MGGLLLVMTSVTAQQSGFIAAPIERNIYRVEQEPQAGFVFDITVQNVEQLDAILKRAEKLSGTFDNDNQGRIALVLHGMELELFRKQNYAMYSEIVEQARLLDQNDLIDIKACQTVMRNLQIEQSELPEFIEQVPLAPVEIERLMVEQGFTRL